MNLIFEDQWMAEVNGEKVTFKKFIAGLLNQDQETPKYIVATNEDPNKFTIMYFVDDPMYPDGAFNSPFEVTINVSGMLFFSLITDQELFNKLVAQLKVENAIIATRSISRETIEKLRDQLNKL